MDVICEKHKTCDEAPYCGGAKPHNPCSECGNCPRDKTAKCIPVDSNVKLTEEYVVGIPEDGGKV